MNKPLLLEQRLKATLKYPSLRKWEQAVKYAIDIAGDLNHWAAGWIEWNVLLDGRGGPTCIGPGVDTERTPESATYVFIVFFFFSFVVGVVVLH